jgi:hypothetical protein
MFVGDSAGPPPARRDEKYTTASGEGSVIRHLGEVNGYSSGIEADSITAKITGDEHK